MGGNSAEEKKNKSLLKVLVVIVIIGIIVLLPFAIELILIHGPSISKFENEEWFSFCGSYIGSIITLLVLYLTIKNSKEESIREYKKIKIQDDYNTEKEKIKKIVDFLLLNDINFADENTLGTEMRNFVQELHTVSMEIKHANRKTEERDEFYKFLYSNCLFYNIRFSDLLNEPKEIKNKEYLMTEMRKLSYNLKDEIYQRKNKYMDYLDESEKKEINALYKQKGRESA